MKKILSVVVSCAVLLTSLSVGFMHTAAVDMNALVTVVANAIADPRMSFSPDQFDSTSMSFADMLALYEELVLAVYGLTGSIVGEPNFPDFTWQAHGITPGHPARVITAMRNAVRRVDVRMRLDYSQVPEGSGWSSNFNFTPAQAERNALEAIGGPRHEIEHLHTSPPDLAGAAPDFAAFPRYSLEPDVLLYPVEHAVWTATMAVYTWISQYDYTDNPWFPALGTDLQKLEYLVDLPLRDYLNGRYQAALDIALRTPLNAFHYLQTQWFRYQADPSLQPAFVAAVNRYFNMPEAPAPAGFVQLRAEQEAALVELDIISRFGTFFNGYRLQLMPAAFARYSNDQLRAEYAAVQTQLQRFANEFDEAIPSTWEAYLQTVRQAIFLRVFDGIADLDSYDFDNLTLWAQVTDIPLSAAQQAQLSAAQHEARYRVAMAHESLHEDLLAGRVAPWFDNWLPTRGLQNPIALTPGYDEFHATYEQVLHTIEQLEVLLNSQWLAERTSEMPAIELPELNMKFLSRLGEMTIDLPTQRAIDPVFNAPPLRRHIEAHRGHVFLYLLHEMLEQEVGLDFIAWLTQELIASEDIDLTPADEPFFATFVGDLVHENITTNALPNLIFALQTTVQNILAPMLNEPLLRRPGDVTGRGLIDDVLFAQLESSRSAALDIDLTLGYMLEQITGRNRYGITLGDMLDDPRLSDMLGLAGLEWAQLLLGLQDIPLPSVDLTAIEDPALRQQAFLDLLTQSMTGMAPFLQLVFADAPNQTNHVQGRARNEWRNDLVVGLSGVTQNIEDTLNAFVGPFVNAGIAVANAGIAVINWGAGLFGREPVIEPLPPFSFDLLLPNLRLSELVRPGGMFEDYPVYWAGSYDARRGISTNLTAANAYGRLILPLFEMLGMDDFIAYSEDEFNSAMATLTDNEDIAQMLTEAIFEPLLNWLPSLGSLTGLLDLLPNLALVADMVEDAFDDVIDSLHLNGTLYLGGAQGDALAPLELTLANFLQLDMFDPMFFLALFSELLPTLIDVPSWLQPAFEGEYMLLLFRYPFAQILALADPETDDNFTAIFTNRLGANGQVCDYVTLLEGRGQHYPSDFVRQPTLGSLAGFFGGDSRAFTFDFGFDLGNTLNAQLPLLDHFSGVFTDLLTQPESDFMPDEPLQNILAGIMDNPNHSIAWLVELFNMQRYPARDFMRYTWGEQAQARNPVHNPVRYSDVWTRQMADRMSYRLPEFLDNFSDLLFETTFLEWLNLPEIDREAILESVMERLEPHIPMLRIMLLEDDLLLLGDLIGFSGYDGYRHGVIPILEAFGVPQRYILTHDEFMAQAADCDEQFIRLIFDPLLDVLERVIADPIHELPRVLPNIIYFISAEEPDRPSNLVTAVNRMLRPLYAIADMLAPMADIEDVMVLLGIEYPFVIDIAGVTQELRLPIEPALNTIFTNMLRNWFGDFTEEIGLSLELEDLLDLVTGTLTIFRSVNGQNDAVRLETDLPDAFTHLARQLIPLILSDENWGEMRLLIAARLPANTRNRALNLLDGLADLLRDTDDDSGPDLVLAVLFYVFTGADCIMEHLLTLRHFRRQLEAFFGNLTQNDTFWIVAVTALGALATVGTVGFFAVLAHNVRHRRNNESTDVLAAYYGDVGIPPTGDSATITVVAAVVGSLALLGALLILKKPQRRAHA
ncbi:MAG: hypothetical protein FWE40_01110 [Oscillospiraceae bacterium]|nr:hypothetical protein [Oscillospiraceae bacterium]